MSQVPGMVSGLRAAVEAPTLPRTNANDSATNFAVTVADLNARLAAAERIASFVERDQVLARIAEDASRAATPEPARTALLKMTSFSRRDDAILRSARLLAAAGRRAEALELADLVTAASKRTALIRELAE